MKLIPRLFATPLAALVALAACGDSTNLTARFDTVEDTLSVFAISGTPRQFPSGLLLGAQNDGDPGGEPVVLRVNEGFFFDAAFVAVVYPYRLVASEFGEGKTGRVRVADEPYEALERAPAGGYQDTVGVSAPVGRTLVIESNGSNYCANDVVRTLYAKLTVDSVRAESREIFFRVRLDPNCGFRSF